MAYTQGEYSNEEATPLWWIILWMVWGLILACLVFIFDQKPSLAACWFACGACIGLVAFRILRPFGSPFLEWYQNFFYDPERTHLMLTLLLQGKDNTEEYTRYIEEQGWSAYLALPPLSGLFHGFLLGGIGGALCSLDSHLNIDASTGAAVGLLVGPILVSGIASVTLAFLVPPLDKRLPLKARIGRRTLLIVSPVLFFPAAWYSLKKVAKRNP